METIKRRAGRKRALCSGRKRLFRALQFPPQMVEVEQQQWLGIRAAEFLKRARGPALGEVLAGIDVLVEKTVLVGDTEELDHSGNHIQMRHQHGLREILGELLIPFVDSGP